MIKTKLPPTNIRLLRQSAGGANVMIENVRIAFVSVASPKKNTLSKEESHVYEVTMLIPRTNTGIKTLQKLGLECIKTSTKYKNDKERKNAEKSVNTIGEKGSLIKDGDEMISKSTDKPYDGFEGMYTIKAKIDAVEKEDGTFKPKSDLKFYRKDKTEIRLHELADEIYSGAWCDVNINLYAFNFAGNQGVTAYLVGIMKLADDTKLGGHDPFEAREDLEEDDDDDDDDDNEVIEEEEEEEEEEKPKPKKKK